MFGLELGKEETDEELVTFDLEEKIKDPTAKKLLISDIEDKISIIKTIIVSGIDKQYFYQAAILLEGYEALKELIEKHSS